MFQSADDNTDLIRIEIVILHNRLGIDSLFAASQLFVGPGRGLVLMATLFAVVIARLKVTEIPT